MSAKELVKRAIEKYDMLRCGQKVLVGFSGGSDSVCLLNILYEQGYQVTACHLNHNMRDTAMRDMLFCEEFCKKRNIPFIKKIAEKGSIKSEADARSVRYRFFEEVMSAEGISVVATAHNKNDSAETVLLNLIRGSALDGLCGIPPKEGSVIRPLIMTSKKEVLRYVNANNLSYMTDETNLTDIYTRNKLRNNIIPLLEKEFNPKLSENLAENAELLAFDKAYLNQMSEKAFSEVSEEGGLSCQKLNELPKALSGRVLQKSFQRASGSGQNIGRIFIEKMLILAQNAKTDTKIDLPFGFEARVEYGILSILKKREKETFLKELIIGEYTIFDDFRVGVFEKGKGLPISLDGKEKLLVRTKKQGDRFSPTGMCGTKSVSDFFTDIKLSHALRAKMPILTADGKIAAVGHFRTDRAFAKNEKKNNYYFIVQKI